MPPFDPATATMTINAEQANRTLNASIGQDVQFTINENVKVKMACTEAFDLTLDDVGAEDTVRVVGKAVDGVYEIRHILIY
jgi:hypothetical protein